MVDVDLSRYFDTIRHDRILVKVAGRVVDGDVLAMVKQFLKSTGDRGVPQGSPLNGPITPMEDAFAVSRDAGNPPSGSMWRGPETE